MKRLITILLAASLALASGVNAAKPAGANTNAAKGPAKSRPVQKPQHISAGPKIHTNNVPKHNELRKPTKVQSRELKTSKAPKLEKSTAPRTTDVVADDKLRKNVKTATLSKEKIAQIRAQHTNFKAKPNTSIASAQFNANYQIAGAQNWSGPQYQAFVSYRPQWHDQGWWQNRYGANLLLIAGGWYYWDTGYWYPAWGYDSAYSYYPYDGPIYVGDNRVPFDQVVADCQATLQEQGYYTGEVDGLMGPLTREALASFQRDHGLITTAALDQPTLSSLGLG
jgi:Putative peptidoglycan binding domain